MEVNPQKIYFDESGFTGNNLIHPSQEFFSYASVATTDEEARDFVGYIIKKYNIQNEELKGKNLVKFNKGRKAIDEIFLTFEGRIKISISNKKYALSCKFFEYIFEPCISDNNALFYNINFHRFISVLIYIEFAAKVKGAEDIFIEFEQLMRDKDLSKLPLIFNSSKHPDNSSTIIQIREFAQSQVEHIRDELESLPGDGIGKWLLDLTDTALFTLLANWGKEYHQITAICDFSKPLHHNQQLFDIMVNREDRVFSYVSGDKHPITFNLSGPIQLVNSKDVHGVQIADTIAAAAVFAARENEDSYARKWRKLFPEIADNGSIIPDTDFIDLNRLDAQRNAMVMLEIHSRATKGLSLLEGMPEYVEFITQQLILNPIPINA